MRTGSPASATSGRAGPALRGLPCRSPIPRFVLLGLRSTVESFALPRAAWVWPSSRRGSSGRRAARARHGRQRWSDPEQRWHSWREGREACFRPPRRRPSTLLPGARRRRSGRSADGLTRGAERCIPSPGGSAMRRRFSRTERLRGCSIGFGPSTSCISATIQRARHRRRGRVGMCFRFGIVGSLIGGIRSSGRSTT